MYKDNNHPNNRNAGQKLDTSEERSKNSWNHLAQWYNGWVGADGSKYHKELAFPTTLDLLELKPGDKVLDIGCGTGVFSRFVYESRAKYYGIDVSANMIIEAEKEFTPYGKFTTLDILDIRTAKGFTADMFDAAIFILSIQDMPNLQKTISNASWAIKKGGRIVIFLKHPAFNIPRQSGWIVDTTRSLTSRRVDRYLSPVALPLVKILGQKTITTFHYHNPLQKYFECFAENGLCVYSLMEFPDPIKKDEGSPEIPQFMAIGAYKT